MAEVSTDPIELPQSRFLRACADAGLRWRQTGPDQWRGNCPAHRDHKASAALRVIDEGCVVHCHAGCDWRDVLTAVGLRPDDVQPKRAGSRKRAAEAEERARLSARRSAQLMRDDDHRLDELCQHEGWRTTALEALVVGLYDDRVAIPERDHRGRVLGFALYRPRYRRSAGSEDKGCEPGGKRGLTYRAGGLASSRVVIVEGPSCAVSTLSLGFEPLAIPSASFDVPVSWWSILKGLEVFVVPDNDEQGLRIAETTAEALRRVVERVSLCEPVSAAQRGYDVADLLRDKGPERARQRMGEVICAAEVIPRPKRGRPPTDDLQRSTDYLRDVLADGRWHDAREVEEGRPASEYSYKAARKALGVRPRKTTDRWQIQLPKQRPRRLSLQADRTDSRERS